MEPKEKDGGLADLVAGLKEEEALECAQKMIDRGEAPLAVLEQCRQGLFEVGKRYEARTYFISALIMGGEIMNRISTMIVPLLSCGISGEDSGNILLGTVQGDIHFIGKDLFKVMARCHGFSVTDLGVDVQPVKFWNAALESRPDIIGISCLLDAGYESLKETFSGLKQTFPDPADRPAFIIGGAVDKMICDHTGADYWTNDAMTGVRLCQKVTISESA